MCTPPTITGWVKSRYTVISPLNAELNPICHLLALLAHHILHVSWVRFNYILYMPSFGPPCTFTISTINFNIVTLYVQYLC